MTTITINERTDKGKSLLEFLRKFEGEKFISIGHEPNEETKQAIEDTRKGKLKSYKNSKELFSSIKSKVNV